MEGNFFLENTTHHTVISILFLYQALLHGQKSVLLLAMKAALLKCLFKIAEIIGAYQGKQTKLVVERQEGYRSDEEESMQEC